MKFSSITREENERPERLYQRLIAHLQDNLLDKGSALKYDGETMAENEIMSPTVYRLAVLRWMDLIHPKLSQLVARTYAQDLLTMSLRDLQLQICRAIPGFLEELAADEAQIEASRAYVNELKRRTQTQRRFNKPSFLRPPAKQPKPECRFCKAEGRPYTHALASCIYISKAEKMAK